MGAIDAHEHLFIASPAMRGGEIDDVGHVLEEVRDGKATGLTSFVELTPIGLGRRPELMRRVARETGTIVIGATGYHRDEHYPAGHWVHEATTELLARRIVADLRDGMHPRDWEGDAPPDPARAGVIKAGASYQHVSAGERRRLEAAAIGSVASGGGHRGPHGDRHVRPRDHRPARGGRRGTRSHRARAPGPQSRTWNSTPRSWRAA